MNYGFIYCLGNDAMPGIYKIGMTDRAPSQRCWELSSSTAAALPFNLMFYAEVDCARDVERDIHADLAKCRVNVSREFFSLTLNEIHDYFEEYAIDVCVTSAGEEALRMDSLKLAFYNAVTEEDRAEKLVAWARALGVRMCRDGDIVRIDGQIRTPAFASARAACFAMKPVLLRILPDVMPETGLVQILRSVDATAEVEE